MLEVLRVAPDFLAPVLDEIRVILKLGLEVGEATTEDQNLVWDVQAIALELIACLCVYLNEMQSMYIAYEQGRVLVRTRAAFGPLSRVSKGRFWND